MARTYKLTDAGLETLHCRIDEIDGLEDLVRVFGAQLEWTASTNVSGKWRVDSGRVNFLAPAVAETLGGACRKAVGELHYLIGMGEDFTSWINSAISRAPVRGA